MAAAGLVLLVVAFGVAAPLALYALVRREAEDSDRMSREEARERVSRDRDDR
ncbi:hypothetical protein [Halobacterium yunchengense]|uniref:hypothetical protein n=1 Tax=Halobacterium yunchengense TaxID=3108497 RepID=UPI0030083259